MNMQMFSAKTGEMEEEWHALGMEQKKKVTLSDF